MSTCNRCDSSQHDLLASKNLLVPVNDMPRCINCFAAGMNHSHMATSRDCPFFLERNNRSAITGLLNIIRDRRMEGHDNPFGATRVRSTSLPHAASSSAPTSTKSLRPGHAAPGPRQAASRLASSPGLLKGGKVRGPGQAVVNPDQATSNSLPGHP